MSRLLQDIIGETAQFRRALDRQAGGGFAEIKAAVERIRGAEAILIVGMGASWNAAVSLAHAFNRHGKLAMPVDASEFEVMAHIPKSAAVLFLSRSGRSVELVHGVARCAREGIATIAITNDPDSPVARGAGCPIYLGIAFDNAVSVATYTALILVGALLAIGCAKPDALAAAALDIRATCDAVEAEIPAWRATAAALDAAFASRFTYFLARGESLGSAHAGMLLWEEVGKTPAAALTTGAFRHGPQEVLREPTNMVAWLSSTFAAARDAVLVQEMKQLGAHTIVIAEGEPAPGFDMHFRLPPIRREYRAAFDCIPVQLLADSLARIRGVDPDRFLYASYIVEKDNGLTQG